MTDSRSNDELPEHASAALPEATDGNVEQKNDNDNGTKQLEQFEVDGIVPVVEDGDVLPHFGAKKRGKYIKHKQLSQEEILELRREQNREAARRMRAKKAQQRKFLEEQIMKTSEELQQISDDDNQRKNELKQKIDEMQKSRQEIIAVQNRSSQSKKNNRKRSSSFDTVPSPLQKKAKLAFPANTNTNTLNRIAVAAQLPAIPNSLAPLAGVRRPNAQLPPALIIKPTLIFPSNYPRVQSATHVSSSHSTKYPACKNKPNTPFAIQRQHSSSLKPSSAFTPMFMRLTPAGLTPAGLFASPQQMFSFPSPHTLHGNRWMISPMAPQHFAPLPNSQISPPNLNGICVPSPAVTAHINPMQQKQQQQQHNMLMRDVPTIAEEKEKTQSKSVDIKKEESTARADVTMDSRNWETEEKSKEFVRSCCDKKIGTDNNVTCVDIGVNTDLPIQHQCGQCDKLLICPQHLLDYHRAESIPESFACFQCDAVFDCKELLQSHVKQRHEEIVKRMQSLFDVKIV